ncbi:hypothetical protein [Actinoplanes sp. RD1]|uniref:hypothetical protein n=1 Tax=Actinoplanes sp. RD1 TaxID=3064538 RepID=UPI0027414BEA|nr:hypothetical protein [Actinoplanes sp. RD1]
MTPDACTLPAADRPLRLAELGTLIATAVRSRRRLSATVLRWELDPAAEAEARSLAARESRCCSFFSFTFRPGPASLRLDIEVPPAYAAVLDRLS